MSTVLRERTSEAHRRTERHPLHRALARGTISRLVWVRYLEQQLVLARALAARLERLTTATALRAVAAFGPDRDRAPDLARDLGVLGGSPTPVPLPATRQAADAAATATDAAALGMLYVVEGSTNGGRFLRLRAAPALGLDPDRRDGLRYLDPYGDAQPDRWATFKLGLDSAGFTGPDLGELTAGAEAMFAAVGAISDAVWITADTNPAPPNPQEP